MPAIDAPKHLELTNGKLIVARLLQIDLREILDLVKRDEKALLVVRDWVDANELHCLLR